MSADQDPQTAQQPGWTRARRCASSACVEVALVGEAVHVRDRAGTVIELRPDAWALLLASIRAGNDHPNPQWIAVGRDSTQWLGVSPRSGVGPVVLRFTRLEWDTFVTAVEAGEFDTEQLAGVAA